MRNPLILLLFIFYFLPQISFGAGISITEIMYDAQGSDGGREWIEVYNNSGSEIDLTSYKFFENGTAHSISHFEGDALMPNNSYAIIADNANNFISEYSDASKQKVYDASFSLSNSLGEYLAIKDNEGSIVFELTYDPSIGVAGDGNSLQKNNTNNWAASIPTVLAGFVESNNTNNINDTQSNQVENTNTVSGGSSSTVSTKKETVMHFEFTTPKTIIAGNDNIFKATLYGSNGEIINYGEFVWNFGDGNIQSVKNLDEVRHTYLYPGDYIITCTYKYTWNPKPILVGRVNALVVDSPFELTKFYSDPRPAVGITNKRDTEYDISKYIIKTNNGDITLPEGTFIGGKDEIVLILPQGNYDQNSITLLNPLGVTVSSFTKVEKEIEKIPLTSTNLMPPAIPYVDYTQNLDSFETNENIPNPKIIELEASAGSAKNSASTLFIVMGLILVGSMGIFYIRSYRKNKESLDLDDYTLQDE